MPVQVKVKPSLDESYLVLDAEVMEPASISPRGQQEDR